MVLPIVVNTDRKIAIDKSEYNHGMENGLPMDCRISIR